MFLKTARRNHFFVNMKTAYGNLGDLLINRNLLRQLSDWGQVHLNVAGIPDDFLEGLELDSKKVVQTDCFYRDLIRSLVQNRFQPKNKRRNIAVVTIPGHFFGGGYTKCLSVTASGCVLHILRLLGAKILKFGGCVGPLSRAAAVCERFRAKAFSFYSVRDSISQGYCARQGFRPELFPDLAFVADYQIPESTNDLQNYLVLSFRAQTHALEIGNSYVSDLVRRLDELLNQLATSINPTIVICHQVVNDQRFCSDVCSKIESEGYRVRCFEKQLTLDEALQLYNGAAFVLSNRLHVLLLALVAGSIPIAVIDKEKHHKITGIFSDENIGELVCDIKSSVDSRKFIKNRLLNIEEDKKKLKAVREKTYETAKRTIEKVVKEIGFA